MPTRGVVYVHSCPPAVVPHVEWAVSGVLGTRVSLSWTAQPAAPGQLRAECAYTGRPGTASKIAAALRSWSMVRFEVAEDPSDGYDGERISYVPGRGVYRTSTGANGDVVVGEQQLRACRIQRLRDQRLHAPQDQLGIGLLVLLGHGAMHEVEVVQGLLGQVRAYFHRWGLMMSVLR